MEFYLKKFIEIRTIKKITLSELSRKAEISRVTLWRIEKGDILPKEKYIRAIAKGLGIGVEEISDLPKDIPITEKDLFEERKTIKKWISFEDSDDSKRKESESLIIKAIQEKFTESDKAVRLIKTLINFSDAMLYVKDYKQKYMAASKAFLDLVSLPSELSISGKTDLDIFGEEEAKKNTNEDQHVILSGKSIKNKEYYIPGSRKKRYGLISKIPTFDNNGKLTGLVGSFIDITERKKTEFLANDLKQCIEFLENKIIWLGTGKIIELKNKSLCPKEIIYISDSFVKKKASNAKTISSYNEYMEFLDSLKETPVPHDIDKLKKEGFSTIYYRIKTPDNKEILNCKSSIYYINKFELYFEISELDIVKSYTDLLINDILALDIDEALCKQIKKIINSCENAIQSRIEYDKFVKMKETSQD